MPVTQKNMLQLKAEYTSLYMTCSPKPGKLSQISNRARLMVANKSQYFGVANPLGIPWFAVALIHSLETDLNFKRHLYNGDPLSARTTRVPAGRPRQGEPPFEWAFSATHALLDEGWSAWKDWSVVGTLLKCESYNGSGYRNHGINSPYLWSFSNHYSAGKYGADGVYDPGLVSAQIGVALLIQELISMGAISTPIVASDSVLESIIQTVGPKVRFSKSYSPSAEQLQEALAIKQNLALTADGVAGRATADAYFSATGQYLHGDPKNHFVGTR